MSKPSLTNCPKLAAAPAARGVPAQSWYNERYMKQDVPLQLKLQPMLLARKYLQVQIVLSKRYSGGYSVGDHLFPFRTEKLSPTAPMVLHTRGRVGRRQLYFQASFSVTTERGFFVSAHICAFAHLHICSRICTSSPAHQHIIICTSPSTKLKHKTQALMGATRPASG